MGKRQEAAQQTRAAIVKASEELISERGIEHVTIADIAERAGVSVGSFYTYFKRKEDVVTDMVTVHFDSIMASASALEGIGDALTAFLMDSIRYIRDSGVLLCRSWIVSSLISDRVAGIPGNKKLENDSRFIASLFRDRGIDPDPSIPLEIIRFYYGIVLCWAFTDGSSDPVAEMDVFCRGPMAAILSGAGNGDPRGHPAGGRCRRAEPSRSGRWTPGSDRLRLLHAVRYVPISRRDAASGSFPYFMQNGMSIPPIPFPMMMISMKTRPSSEYTPAEQK